MWKTGITSLAILATSGPAMADAIERIEALEDFAAISYALPYAVEFVQTSTPFVQLDGDEKVIAKIEVEIKRGTLYVSRKNGSWWDSVRGRIDVVVGYESIEAITMAGSGDGIADAIEADKFHIKIAGSARLEVDGLTAETLNVSISGSGDVDLSDVVAKSVATSIAGSGKVRMTGITANQSLTISGSGDYNARGLQSSTAHANIRGSGDAVLWVSDELDATVMGSGDIDYYGNAKVSRTVRGSGDLRHRGSAP